MRTRTLVSLALAVAAAGILAGCATRVSTVHSHGSFYQAKFPAFAHWDIMAIEVVDQALADPKFAGRNLAVSEPGNASVFVHSFSKLLKTELLKRERLDPSGGDGVPTLYVQTQMLRHGRHYLVSSSPVVGDVKQATIQMNTRHVYGTPGEATSELLVISQVQESGMPKMAVKQIVYVDRDEDLAFYSRRVKAFGDDAVPAVQVTTQP